MKKELQNLIFEIAQKIFENLKLEKEEIEIAYPSKKFGDYSSNISMKLASRLKRSPVEIAREIKEELEKEASDDFEKIEVAGPGFLNFKMAAKYFAKVLLNAEKNKETFGLSKIGEGKKVMIEFGQPNTHKAFHVGHLKSAISGLSLVRLYEAIGYKVIKVNYYGDVGMHVAKATWGVKDLGFPEEIEIWNAHEKMKWINTAYVHGAKKFGEDKDVEASIRKLNIEIYNKSGEDFELYEKIKNWSLEHLDLVFKKLGVEYDKQYPESEVFAEGIKVVEAHQDDLFIKSDGAWIYEGKKDGLTNWVFLTGEGNATYSAKDLALGLRKFKEFNPDLSIITTSIEQIDYFRAVIHCLETINPDIKDRYVHVPFGWLLVNGKKTSSRKGVEATGMEVIDQAEKLAKEKISERATLEGNEKEVIEKVALAGLKFLILSHEFHNNINYDPDDFIKLEGFSGPFVLYSSVRAKSILSKLDQKDLTKNDLQNVQLKEEEVILIKKLMQFPELLLEAANKRAPHLLCRYLYELSKNFNLFYDKCSIKNEKDEEIRAFRALLVGFVVGVFEKGLRGLGIDVPEKM